MQQMLWLDHMPKGSIDGGVERANELLWNIEVEEEERIWSVWAGDQRVYFTDDHAGLEAFLYGFGLAYGVLPDPIFQQLKKTVLDWAGEPDERPGQQPG